MLPQGPTILDSIGNTPLIELKSISRDVAPVRIFGKAEFLNPGGSVKDRAAGNMVREGLNSGDFPTDEKILLDATSGNTGIAYAMIAAAMNFRVRLCVPLNMSQIRRSLLTSYGAELVLTDPTKGSDGAIEEAIRIYEESPELYFYPDQYSNEHNWKAHFKTTGPELIEQTQGEITHFVSGLGTTGTLMGTGRYLKEINNDIQLISFQPDSPMHGLEGLKHMPTSLVPSIYNDSFADENRWIRTEDAQLMVKRAAKEEGLLIGMSAGAALHCAVEKARELKEGIVVAVLCDTGQRYLDMQFWKED